MVYPWYQVVSGGGLEQGDILESCPVFLPRNDPSGTQEGAIVFDEELRDISPKAVTLFREGKR